MRLGTRVTNTLTLKLTVAHRPAGMAALAYNVHGGAQYNNCISLNEHARSDPSTWVQIIGPTVGLIGGYCVVCGCHVHTHP